MNSPFISSFFNRAKTLITPESVLIKTLRQVAQEHGLLVYKDITIYHYSKSFFIPFLILDAKRGIYLFEYKKWSYDELKGSKIQKATQQTQHENTLAFEQSQDAIKQRFYELTKNDTIKIFNYLLMENLNSEEYDHLDKSFQELLPKDKIMFNNSTAHEILNKLQQVSPVLENLPSASKIISTILIQYSIVDNNSKIHLCTQEQMDFIDAKISTLITLNAKSGSGKTSTLLLKAIVEKLKNNNSKIIILKPTTLSCDILKRKLLNTIEAISIEIDLTSIEIITPLQLLNKHLTKLGKKEKESLEIDKFLMRKKAKIADTILCDDADFLSQDFIHYLMHIQKESALVLVTSNSYKDHYTFEKSFRAVNQTTHFYQSDQYKKTLSLIQELLAEHSPQDILVVSSKLSREKVYNDLIKSAITDITVVDNSKKLFDQNLKNILLATYNDIIDLNAKFVLLLDVPFAPHLELAYAFYLASNTTYVIYEDECEQIDTLRKTYENHKK